MQFQVKNRFNGAVQFTAEIECDDDDAMSIKLGMYVHLKSEATGCAAAAERSRIELLALAKDAERVLLPCGVSYRVKKSGRGKTIDPYIPETPTAAPTREPILAGG